ncbi:MAG TPA: DUF835 domain-containing protein [Methanomassiliicoccales archaeon]|nr:DUF835 domain-containing protein [Methanomassiliicoccales archaeon]
MIPKLGRRITLLIEGYPRKGFQLYSRMLKEGASGVCVSRLHPDYVQQKFDVHAPTYWLSSCKGKDVLSPKQVTSVVKAIRSALDPDAPTVVFLDGIEYLLLYNDLAKVETFLKDLERSLENTNAEVVVALDPLTMEQRDLEAMYATVQHITVDDLEAMLPMPQPQQTVAAAPLSAGQTV